MLEMSETEQLKSIMGFHFKVYKSQLESLGEIETRLSQNNINLKSSGPVDVDRKPLLPYVELDDIEIEVSKLITASGTFNNLDSLRPIVEKLQAKDFLLRDHKLLFIYILRNSAENAKLPPRIVRILHSWLKDAAEENDFPVIHGILNMFSTNSISDFGNSPIPATLIKVLDICASVMEDKCSDNVRSSLNKHRLEKHIHIAILYKEAKHLQTQLMKMSAAGIQPISNEKQKVLKHDSKRVENISATSSKSSDASRHNAEKPNKKRSEQPDTNRPAAKKPKSESSENVTAGLSRIVALHLSSSSPSKATPTAKEVSSTNVVATPNANTKVTPSQLSRPPPRTTLPPSITSSTIPGSSAQLTASSTINILDKFLGAPSSSQAPPGTGTTTPSANTNAHKKPALHGMPLAAAPKARPTEGRTVIASSSATLSAVVAPATSAAAPESRVVAGSTGKEAVEPHMAVTEAEPSRRLASTAAEELFQSFSEQQRVAPRKTRIQWADEIQPFGSHKLVQTREFVVDVEESTSQGEALPGPTRGHKDYKKLKKAEHRGERELLLKRRHLVEDDLLESGRSMVLLPMVPWKTPPRVVVKEDPKSAATKGVPTPEYKLQNQRQQKKQEVHYDTVAAIPNDPAPVIAEKGAVAESRFIAGSDPVLIPWEEERTGSEYAPMDVLSDDYAVELAVQNEVAGEDAEDEGGGELGFLDMLPDYVKGLNPGQLVQLVEMLNDPAYELILQNPHSEGFAVLVESVAPGVVRSYYRGDR